MIVPLEELIQAPLGGPRPEAEQYEQPAEGYAEQPVEAYGEGEYAAEGEQAGYAAEHQPGEDANPTEGQGEYADPNVAGAAPSEAVGESQPTAEIQAEGEAGYEALPGEVAHDPAGHDQWAIQEDDDSVQYGETEYEQSDVAFGFDPDPAPPAGPPGGKAK